MGVYILKRLALMIPTLFGIMVINFIIYFHNVDSSDIFW